MSNDATFFRQQADKQWKDAADAALDNVRERCERAASSWEVMAARADRTEKLRTERQAASSPSIDTGDDPTADAGAE